MLQNLPFCGGACVAVVFVVGCCKTPPAVSTRPTNVVLILADDLGYGDLGCYGQRRIHTPNLDRMASEGLRFSQAYAGSSVCSPSRCSLLTGLDTGHSFLRGNSPELPLPENTVTIASVMRDAGYATALVGKWDQGGIGTSGEPMRQGFGLFFGYDSLIAAHNYWPQYLWWNSDRVPLPNKVRAVQPSYSKTPGGVAFERGAYAPDVIEREAMRFIGAHKEAPFFLMWMPTFPHANNEAQGNGMEVPDAGAYAAEAWPEPERNYAAMVTLLDAEVGRLLDYLRKEAMDRNTLVIFASDNGPHREGGVTPDFFDSNGPFRGCKRDLYEGGIRVPLIIWGGGIEKARVIDSPAALWDLMATLSTITHRAPPPGDGRPLPLAEGAAPATDERVFYWEMNEPPVARAVRKGKWKLIDFYGEGRVELYDIENDAGEARDIAAQNEAVVSELSALMDRHRSFSPYWTVVGAGWKSGH